MKILPVTDKSFAPYGRIVEGYDVAGILKALEESTPCPESTVYFPKVDALRAAPGAEEVGEGLFGGMPFQLGFIPVHSSCQHFSMTSLSQDQYKKVTTVNPGNHAFCL